MIITIKLRCMKCDHKGEIKEIVVTLRDLNELKPCCSLCGNQKNEYFEVTSVSLGGKK